MSYDSYTQAAYEFENNYEDSSSQNNDLQKYNNDIIFSNTIKKFGNYSATQNVSNNWVYTTNAISTVKTVEVWFYIDNGDGYWNLTEGWLNNSEYKIGIAESAGNVNVYTADYGWLNLNYYLGSDRFDGWYGLAVKFNDSGYNRLYTTDKGENTFFERTNSTDGGTYEPNGLIWRFFSNIQDLPNTSIYIDRAIFSSICRTTLPTLPIDLKIFSINPNIGSILGGQYVEILGQGFNSDAKVYFGDNLAQNITVVSANKITCITPPAQSAGYVNVKVENSINEYEIMQNAYLYINLETQEIENAEIKMYIDKENYVANSLLTNLNSKVYDKKYCHYNVETNAFDLHNNLSSGTQATINFQSNKTINRITIYFYPKNETNFPGVPVLGNKIKLEYFDAETNEWKNIYAVDFNKYFCLPEVKYHGDGIYENENCGIIALFLQSAITTQYVRITAQVDVAITEIEITYAYEIYPTACRINSKRDIKNKYLGMSIFANIWDENFGFYDNIEVNQNAYISVNYKNNVKYFGKLKLKDVVLDVKNRVVDIELVDFIDDLKTNFIQKNVLYDQTTNNNDRDVDEVLEWILYNAYFHRDLFFLNISGNFWYFPKLQNVYDEINEILEIVGDGVIINSNGLLQIKSRVVNTVETSEANESMLQMQYTPILNKVYNDFLWIRGFDNVAPLQGFSIAETYTDIFRNIWTANYSNVSFSMLNDIYHYKMIINNGYIQLTMSELRNFFGAGTNYNHRAVFQFVLEKNQGTKSFSVYIFGEDYGYTDNVNLNTDQYKYRICYYMYNETTTYSGYLWYKKYIRRRIYDEETGTQLSDVQIFVMPDFAPYDYVPIVNCKISCSSSLSILGIGRTRMYRRSYVFSFDTIDCVEYLTYQYVISNSNNIMLENWSLSSTETTPNLIANNGKINSNAGNSLKILFFPYLYLIDYNANYNPDSPLDLNNHNWTTFDFLEKTKVYFMKYNEVDIEDGNIGIEVRNIFYKKSEKKVDEDIVKNKIDIKENLIIMTSGTLIDDENKKIHQQIDITIQSDDYEANFLFDTIINRNANRHLYLKFDKAGEIYEYNISLSALSNLVNYMLNEVEIQVSLYDYPLGAYLKLHPTNTTYTRICKEIKYYAYNYKNSGENVRNYYNSSSIAKYGVLEEKIENDKIVFLSNENYNKIIQKYNRFFSNIYEQIDNIPCNLNLNIDLNKYVYFYDDVYKKTTIQYKLYEFEHLIDINNLNFETRLTGRVQNYGQY